MRPESIFLFVHTILLFDNIKKSIGQEQKVTRSTDYGEVTGFLHKTPSGNIGEVFLGVPYAKPPVGELRLKYPEPPVSWMGYGPYDATYRRPWCVQFWYPDERIEKRHQSEDCLYANIISPYQHSRPPPYPVLFWVHGGSYQVGGANAFPINGTVDNLVAKGLVVVNINYRLGPLGFASSLNSNLPGNFGLEDQIQALKWVQQNIHYFDGDPELVTIGGESAGAASVSLLGVSPKARGLFHRLIIRSGSSLAPWAVRTINTDLNTDRLISGLGCKTDPKIDKLQTLLCLQLKDWREFKSQWRNIAQDDLLLIMSKSIHKPVHYNHPFLAHTYFTPVIDGYRLNDSLLPHYPEELVRNNSRLPIMIGSTSGECTGYVTWLSFLEKTMGLNLHDLEYVVPSSQYANPEQVKQATYKQYIGDNMWKEGFNFRKALVEIASDQNFVAPIAQEAKLYAEKGLPVFVYSFDHGNDELYRRHTVHGVLDVGSSHGFDMVYLFQSTSVVDPGGEIDMIWSDDDLNATDVLSRTTYKFVLKGNPNFNDSSKPDKLLRWPSYSHRCYNSLRISKKASVSDYHPEAYHFWIRTIKVLQTASLRRGYKFSPETICLTPEGRGSTEIDYRTAFYVTLAAAILLFIFLGFTCFAQLTIKRESVQEKEAG